MSRFRMFVLSLWVTCVCVGLVDGEEAVEEASAEPHSENPVVFGGVEVCGPIIDALLYLGPKDELGKLDPERIELWPHPSGLYRALMPPSEGASMEFAGQTSSWMMLGEFEGKTQAVRLVWRADEGSLLEIWTDMNAQLRMEIGDPVEINDDLVVWQQGALSTVITLVLENEIAEFTYYCIPTEERFWAKVNSVSSLEEPLGPSEASNEYRPPERVLGTPLLSVLGVHGEPDGGPYHRGPGAIGLYYEGIDFLGIPSNAWFWFVEGGMVHRGTEFAPPFGASRAMEAFWGFKKRLSSWYGEPFITIGGEGFDRIEHHWLNGPEETILRLEMADDPPWFRFEVIDRDRIHLIEGDLRPDRKPIPRYVPPPKDSGKTRHQLVGGNARG